MKVNSVSPKLDEGHPWWNVLELPSFGLDPVSLGWASLAFDVVAMAGGPPKLDIAAHGLPPDMKEFLAAVKALGGREMEVHHDGNEDEDEELMSITPRGGNNFIYYIWPDALMIVDHNIDVGTVSLQGLTNNPELLAKAEKICSTLSEKAPTGSVHVMISSQEGIRFESIGIGGQPLIRENYSDEVLEAFDKIVEDFGKSDPTGRLSILNGDAGTGKTYILRALIQTATNCTCVIVQPDLISQLASPNIISSLRNLRYKKGVNSPIIFFVEDADSCLVSRESGDMSSISAVLNLCDGILGTLLDIRLIATTNAKRMELDKALVRPGRLSANVEVKALSYEQSKEVFKRLHGDSVVAELPEVREYTLAELYNLFKDGSVLATGMSTEVKGKVGF